jgi:hypothetical protein
MRKLVVLKLDGDLETGVRVTLEIGERDERPNTEVTGQLPPIATGESHQPVAINLS